MAVVIFLFSLIVFSFQINQAPLHNWDEAWYAQIIKEIASGVHGYLFPFWNGQYYLDKPPLYFWLSLPVVKIFGQGEWQMRLVSVIASALSVVLIYLIGKKLFNNRTAIFSSLSFIIMGQVIERLSKGNLDGLLIFTILLCLYVSLSLKKLHTQLLLSFCLSLVILTKSWLYLPFTVLLILFISPNIDKKLFFKSIVLSFILPAIWYLLGLYKFGPSFFSWYLFLTGAWKVSTIRLDLLTTLVRDQLFLLPLIFIALTKSKQKLVKPLFLFSIFYIFALHFYQESFGWYLLPIYPLLAILSGVGANYLSKSKTKVFLFLFVFQLFIPVLVYLTPDNSTISYNLGTFLRSHLKQSDTVYLYYPDFPSVLYYSGLNQISVVSDNDPKVGEYWMINNVNIKSKLPGSYLLTPKSAKINAQPISSFEAPDSFILQKF